MSSAQSRPLSWSLVRGRTPHLFWSAALAVLVLGALLRLGGLEYQSLWVDEFITLQVAQTPLLDLPLEAAERDSQPPLYYLLVKAALVFGSNEISLRMVSALAGLATIPALGWIALQVAGPGPALITMGILALSPFHVWYSQEARAYALVLFFLTLSVGFLLRMGEVGRSSRLAWTGFVVTTALALYTHLMALPFLLVQLALGVWASVRAVGTGKDRASGAGWGKARGRLSWRWILLGQAVALVLFLPEAVLLFRHAWLHYLLPPLSVFLEGPTRTYGMSPSGVARLFADTAFGVFTLLAGFSLGPSVRELHEAAGRSLQAFLTPSVLLFCGLIGVAGWLGVLATRRGNPLSQAGLIWTIVVLLAIPAAVFFAEAPFRPRYVAIALPGVILWLAGSSSAPATVGRRYAAAVALVAAFALPLSARHQERYLKDDVRSAATFLMAARPTGANTVIASRPLVDGLLFYLEKGGQEPALEVRAYPAWGTLTTDEQVVQEVTAAIAESGTAWLLLGRTWETDPQGLTLAAATESFAVEERGAWPGVRLYVLHVTDRR